jgi:hypothetical protein
MSARSEERILGRGRHQEWRAPNTVYQTGPHPTTRFGGSPRAGLCPFSRLLRLLQRRNAGNRLESSWFLAASSPSLPQWVRLAIPRKYGPSQEAHLYQLATTPEELRATFLDYVDAINTLYQMPRWYHGLCTNCTTSFYQLPSRRRRCDWRVLANARLDRALYAAGRLDRSMPFPELRRAAYLNDVANSAPADGFGDYIRRELERRRHER